MDEIDGLGERIEELRRTVWCATADGAVTPAELDAIERSWEAVGRQRGVVQYHVEAIHGTIQIVRGLLYTGDLTPKLRRRVRELSTGLTAIAPRKAA